MADRVVMVSADRAEREALAAEMKKLAENPPTETVDGGRFRNSAGEVVNAFGEPLDGGDESAESEASGAAKTARKAPARRR